MENKSENTGEGTYNGQPITDGIHEGIDPRKQRGLEIAAKCQVSRREDGSWVVPSQSGTARYTVRIGIRPHCTCADHELRGCKCKHVYAAEIVYQRERNGDGTETITKSVSVTEKITRKTYGQNWPAYNAAQVNEKAKLQLLLRDLCSEIEEPIQTMGRPRLPLADMAFAAAFKVYSTVSGRRFACDLQAAFEKGYISRLPHYNSVFEYFESPALTPILNDMIIKSSLPLREVETDFAVDATGISTSRFDNWFKAKYGKDHIKHEWRKMHLICGVKTNIVTAVEVTGGYDADTKFLPTLVENTAKNFNVQEVSADKGYISRKNLDAVTKMGARPYIPFMKSCRADWDYVKTREDTSTLWTKMFHFYSYCRDQFLVHYHKRSNVESTFMAIKAKFGDSVRSRTPVAQTNEILCKVLCHNICCVIQSTYELGIQPQFGLN
jgi:transposase